jgi:hypothetical protein
VDQFWLDASVFIQAKRGLFAFELVPSFWRWLEKETKLGTIRSSIVVYDELVPKDSKARDDLAKWAFEMNDHGLFVLPTPEVIAEFRPIADYVHNSCDRAEGDGFLGDADPWLVAHAKRGNGTVVTEEVPVGTDSKKVKIPNVCTRFGVPWIRTKELLLRKKFQV